MLCEKTSLLYFSVKGKNEMSIIIYCLYIHTPWLYKQPLITLPTSTAILHSCTHTYIYKVRLWENLSWFYAQIICSNLKGKLKFTSYFTVYAKSFFFFLMVMIKKKGVFVACPLCVNSVSPNWVDFLSVPSTYFCSDDSKNLLICHVMSCNFTLHFYFR